MLERRSDSIRSKSALEGALTRRRLLALSAALALPVPAARAASPQRIACLDYGLASTLLPLGLVPDSVTSLADWNRWVIEPAMPKEVIDLGSSWEINMEALVARKPDLILTTVYNDALLPRLEKLAPVFRATVYSDEGGDILPKAYATTRALAARVERQAEAEAFLTRADAFFDACRERLARRRAPPVAMVSFMDARHMRIYCAPGLYHNVLMRLGLENAWKATGNFWGFETLGIENLAKIRNPDTRLLIFYPPDPDIMPKLSASPLWQALPFSQPGRFAILPGALMFGLVNEALRFARIITDYLEQTA
ncbi:ABC transporter substrate-binding protein [Rhizobium paknamense]|uniref:Iron complex transport system substrate-binding protein n=1 Tax=Rhizobium paknamense TaxID=1206817 RepID=A0ABU0IFR3_9HYPH|nr:ABC transporter substrate-binding protein [Rhizobium paknamense]MDQ0457080.1 iron complex transport system substrate-binding protein [Rhizobium paknamense]